MLRRFGRWLWRKTRARIALIGTAHRAQELGHNLDVTSEMPGGAGGVTQMF